MDQPEPTQRSQDQDAMVEPATSPVSTRPKEEALELASSDLRRLERRDWWRLTVVLVVVGLLAGGVCLLAVYASSTDVLRDSEVHIAVTGLMAVIAIFVLFTIYQQVTIVGLRRQVAAQVGMLATLELLRPTGRDDRPAVQRRQFQRFYFDSVIMIEAGTKRGAIYGRTSDISEGGVGAVLPEPLGSGTSVRLEFQTSNGEKFRTHAVVRHRRGFYHGLEFQHTTGEQRTLLKQICSTGTPVEQFADYLSRA